MSSLTMVRDFVVAVVVVGVVVAAVVAIVARRQVGGRGLRGVPW